MNMKDFWRRISQICPSGVLPRDTRELEDMISGITKREVLEAFRYAREDWDKVIAHLMRRDPELFKMFEDAHERIRARVIVRGVGYILERKEVEGLSDKKVAELFYEMSDPEDLEIIYSLPHSIRKKIDELSEYHERYCYQYRWLWEVRVSEMTLEEARKKIE
jgi:Mg/Co/Ni transporter MgtE